jgi:hypothetical protein
MRRFRPERTVARSAKVGRARQSLAIDALAKLRDASALVDVLFASSGRIGEKWIHPAVKKALRAIPVFGVLKRSYRCHDCSVTGIGQ